MTKESILKFIKIYGGIILIYLLLTFSLVWLFSLESTEKCFEQPTGEIVCAGGGYPLVREYGINPEIIVFVIPFYLLCPGGCSAPSSLELFLMVFLSSLIPSLILTLITVLLKKYTNKYSKKNSL